MGIWQDVPGWLTEAEGTRLRELAVRKNVLEIGAFKGRATVAMGQVSHTITVVDHFRGDGYVGQTCPATLEGQWRDELAAAGGVIERTILMRGCFREVLPQLTPDNFGLIYFDADHTGEATKWALDWMCQNGLQKGQAVALHDYEPDGLPQYKEASDWIDVFANGFKSAAYPVAFEVVDRLAILRRVD